MRKRAMNRSTAHVEAATVRSDLRRSIQSDGNVPKCPTFATVVTLVLATLSVAVSERAMAQACGPLDASGSVTCPASGNPYAGGINYNTNNTPLTVTLEPGVTVAIPAGGVANAVNLANTTSATRPMLRPP